MSLDSFSLDQSLQQPIVLELTLGSPIRGPFALLSGDGALIAHGDNAEPTAQITVLVRNVKSLQLVDDMGDTIPIASVRPALLDTSTKSLVVRGVDGTHRLADSDFIAVVSGTGDHGHQLPDVCVNDIVVTKDCVEVESGSVFPGRGWWGRETADAEPLRWLAHRGELLIAKPSEGHDIVLDIEFQGGPALGPDASIVLLAEGGSELGRAACTMPGVLTVTIPAAQFRSPLARFELEVRNPQPRSYKGDSRTLSLRVDRLETRLVEPHESNVQFAAAWQPESGDVRWLDEYANIVVTQSESALDEALVVLVEPGPCLDVSGNTVQLLRSDGSLVAEASVRSAGLLVLPLVDSPLPVGSNDLTLRLVNPAPRSFDLDSRKLNLKFVGAVEQVPIEQALREQLESWNRADPDVAMSEATRAHVRFGFGWHGPEHHEGQVFRWMGDSAELVVEPTAEPFLCLEMLSGPDADPSTPLVARAQDGTVLAEADLSAGRAVLQIDAATLGGSIPHRITISCGVLGVDAQPSRVDRRILATRIVAAKLASADDLAEFGVL